MKVFIRRKVLQERKELPIKKKHLKKLNEDMGTTALISIGMTLGGLLLQFLKKLFPKLGKWLDGSTKKLDEADKEIMSTVGIKEEPVKSDVKPSVEPSPVEPSVEPTTTEETTVTPIGDPPINISREQYMEYARRVGEARKDLKDTIKTLSTQAQDAKLASEMQTKPSVVIAEKLIALVNAYKSLETESPEEFKKNVNFSQKLNSALNKMISITDGIKNIDLMAIIADKQGPDNLYSKLPELKNFLDSNDNWFKFVNIISSAVNQDTTDVESDELKAARANRS